MMVRNGRKKKETKHSSTWMETLPFDMENQTDNFLLAISRTRKYIAWELTNVENMGRLELTELETKLFTNVKNEIEYRKAVRELEKEENTKVDTEVH